MKHILQVLGLGIVIVLLASWGTPTAEKTSFFGEVTTRQGNVLKLTNIRIGRDRNAALVKQIAVYEQPKEHAQATPITGSQNQEIVLTVEPETQLYKKFLDLNEISEVSIPEPDTIWSYRKEKQYGKTEYIEIVIGKPGSSEHYLIDRKMKLFGDTIQEKQPEPTQAFPQKGPEESEVPLPAIKQVRVEGYYFKQESTGQIPPCAASVPQPSQTPSSAHAPVDTQTDLSGIK